MLNAAMAANETVTINLEAHTLKLWNDLQDDLARMETEQGKAACCPPGDWAKGDFEYQVVLHYRRAALAMDELRRRDLTNYPFITPDRLEFAV